jgi:hypothetical protein
LHIGLSGALALLFIALKLTGTIAWSWLWVLSPLWIPLTVVFGFVLVCLVLAAAGAGTIAGTTAALNRYSTRIRRRR